MTHLWCSPTTMTPSWVPFTGPIHLRFRLSGHGPRYAWSQSSVVSYRTGLSASRASDENQSPAGWWVP